MKEKNLTIIGLRFVVVGGSQMLLIPACFFKTGQVDSEKTYDVTFEEH